MQVTLGEACQRLDNAGVNLAAITGMLGVELVEYLLTCGKQFLVRFGIHVIA
jgi:hypothetical protein